MKWYWILLIAVAVIAIGVIIGMNVKKKSLTIAPTLNVVKPDTSSASSKDMKVVSTENADGGKTIALVK